MPQVLFLLYHYFEAREIYNAIRVFIAGYVWMTGFNNFSYYYKYKDFCLGRCEGPPNHPLRALQHRTAPTVSRHAKRN